MARPRKDQLLPVVGAKSHSLCLLTVDPPPGPALASAWPPQAKLVPCLLAAFTGPALASCCPLQAQNCFQPASPGLALPPSCTCQPSYCLATATFGLAPAQLLAAFVGLRLLYVRPSRPFLWLPVGLERPSSCVTVASLGPALASRRPPRATLPRASRQPRQAQLLPTDGLFRLISCLAAASPGQPLASRQPPQAQLLRPDGLFRPGSCLAVAS
ncbi:putative uncharacterized protein FLJ46235 [Hylobates moloch]|uniref:putative uncharacterized protein FLJ46235 n=1 Tax=Hylobates moloch TaxID=81572 RepID=UPI00267603FB|nr:putative uncharacterized protein FLJ46235 [Hylobates moloch]